MTLSAFLGRSESKPLNFWGYLMNLKDITKAATLKASIDLRKIPKVLKVLATLVIRIKIKVCK
jgi:hypothetical protein